MLERYIHALTASDVGLEQMAATRERLRDRFPRGVTRRMTQLGLLLGTALEELEPRADDAVVYASAYAETRTLEAYLESFPAASPTLFQTSIHPSAVQQALIARLLPVDEFFPITGRLHIVAHAMQIALMSEAPRVLLCGGEERGTWLLQQRAASDRTFVFAMALTHDPAGAQARVTMEPCDPDTPFGPFGLPRFFDTLRQRREIDQVAAPGLRLGIHWS